MENDNRDCNAGSAGRLNYFNYFTEVEEEFVAPAEAAIFAPGRGLSGAASAQVIVRPKVDDDPSTLEARPPWDRVIGLGDLTEEDA